MKILLRDLSFMVLISTVLTVIMDPDSASVNYKLPPNIEQSTDQPGFNEALRSCFAERSYGTIECMNRGALTALQSWNDDDCLDFGNVRLERSEGQSRDLLDLDWDPKDFGNVVKAASRMLERRNMKWDLSTVYPGLQMRVGPNLSAGNGVIEFVMDERSNHYHNRQLGTGRLLVRQLVLPFLLGFKFNLAALLPLLFGMLIIITKKALLLTKVALFIAGLLGWNSLFSGFGQFNGINLNNGHGHVTDTHGSLGGLGANVLQDPIHQYQPYRGAQDNAGFPFGPHVIRELVNVYENANQETEESDRRKKNFVWRSDS